MNAPTLCHAAAGFRRGRAWTPALSPAWLACLLLAPPGAAPAGAAGAVGVDVGGRRGVGAEVRAGPKTGATRRVGALTLERCGPAWCGTLPRPLDTTGAAPGTVGVRFAWFPRRQPDRAAQGVLVGVEGGPGYGSIGSAAFFSGVFGPLRDTRDMLLMDARGTGQSQALDCRPLQTAPQPRVADIADCGRDLGDTAPLYSTRWAADDLAALLQALGAPPADVYGVSYGTYFSQTFAWRHPERVRSLVLDGAYPVAAVGGESGWYPSYAPAMRDKFNRVCARSPACAAQGGGSMDRLEALVAQVRAAPYATAARDADGRLRRYTLDAPTLALALFGSAPATATAREADAAARAFAAGDDRPLARLVAETLASAQSRDARARPGYFSYGQSYAVGCQDYSQIYDMTLPPAPRDAQRRAALAERERTSPDTYAPFTIDEFRRMPLDYSYLDACVGWPAPPTAQPPGPPVPADAVQPDRPVLVLSGDLDNITSPHEGAVVAGLYPRGQQVVFANRFHVVGGSYERKPCADGLIQRFIATGEPGDTACADAAPALRTPAAFAHRRADLTGATARADASAGSFAGTAAAAATADDLRIAAAAVHTVADALVRLESNYSGRGPGLRGGHFEVRYRAPRAWLALHGLRWTSDVVTSGHLSWPWSGGVAQAEVQVRADGGPTGRLRIRWTEGVANATATINGTVGGRTVRATMPMP